MNFQLFGFIASGKSTVGEILNVEFPYINIDKINKDLKIKNPKLLKKIYKAVGIYKQDELRKACFGNLEIMKKVQEIMTDPVMNELNRQLKELSNEPIIIIESVLMLPNIDKYIVVKASEDIRRERLKNRNPDLSSQEIDTIINSITKYPRCDYLIDNNSNIDSLIMGTKELILMLKNGVSS